MVPPEEVKKRVARKLTKKRKPARIPSVQYPERLRDGADAQEDVTALHGKIPQYMNQSVFSMIAAAGSKSDFQARFDDDGSSESDSESDLLKPSAHETQDGGPAKERSMERSHNETDGPKRSDSKARSFSRYSMIKSLPKLNIKTNKERSYMSKSHVFPPLSGETSPRDYNSKTSTPRQAPVMSRMLEAQKQANSPLADVDEKEDSRVVPNDAPGPSSLAIRLMEIFGYEEPEEVISEYPCWLMQSVLLQGYMYITLNHICFFAYLPKKGHAVAKSGHLSKRGKQTPKYNRYWFTLKGDVLSYYTDAANLYFPNGNIDLRYGISAALLESKEKGKDTHSFTVTTSQRTYYFKADSAASAKEWVKTLQKVIFRSHNDGDSVKISLPIENVIDIEESPVIDFADTFKIRVIDSDETYAIDEYFFSFFSFGDDALEVLRSMVEDTIAQQIPTDYLSPVSGARSPRDRSRDTGRDRKDSRSHSPQEGSIPALKEAVHATLSPPHLVPSSGRASPRLSGEWPRHSMDSSRKSMDLTREFARAGLNEGARRSNSTSRVHLGRKKDRDQSPSTKHQGSSDSYVHSVEPGTESSALNLSSNETQESASQILDRSDVFHSPTIHRLQQSPVLSSDEARRRSEDSLRTKATTADIRIRPPTRSQTEQSDKLMENHDARGRLSNRPPDQLQQINTSPSLQQLVRAGSYPLQRAAGFAGFLSKRSKRMSHLLATESMGYVEKVSGMWAGGRRHYGDNAHGQDPEDSPEVPDHDEDVEGYGDRFRAHFALPATEKLQATFFGYLHRVLPLYGKIYISDRKFCFRSLLPGTRTKMILPLKDIENVDKEKGFRFGYAGLVIVIKGHEELFFEFSQSDVRDDCAVTLLQGLESIKYLQESGLLTQEDKEEAETAIAEHKMLQEARLDGHNEHDMKLPESADTSLPQADTPSILFDDPRASIINFKPTESLRITCLTIGSRGDVQPYIALCKGLLAEGHKPKIATHAEFEPWVLKHGIEFAPVDGDPAELMRICVENGMFTYSFLKEASGKFRGWIDGLLSSAWMACQNSDILIESPSAMAGIHIAEALEIPYFRAFTMPWTRTRAYPHAFAVPEHKMGGAYNYVTYVMFDNVFWKAIAGQVNRWRKKELNLRSTNLDKMQPNKVPFLYNFSPSVVVPPIDYSDWIRVTGYWFLDEASDWTPPTDLTDFISTARQDGKKIVYIGFGSIVVSDPAALTKTVIESVLKADVRCILSKGWSDRLGTNNQASDPEIPFPPEILRIKAAPHDWLFRQIDAAAHHGGAGTTGASLRAGLPTIIKPFFGDQFFFGSRVEDLGVGICMKKLNVSVFSRTLWEATHSERMIVKARVLGEQIRKENGVQTAMTAIYRDLEYAKSLIKHRAHLNSAGDLTDIGGDEESWTFIGDEIDPDAARRIQEWDPKAVLGERRERRSMQLDRELEGRGGTGGTGIKRDSSLGSKVLRKGGG